MSAATGVSRETDSIVFRLLSWAAWATDREHIPDRNDEVSGDLRLTHEVRARLTESRRGDLTPEIHAIEKAVASLRFEHDNLMLNFMVKQYFIEWKTIERIALEQDMSEYHVTDYLHRALRDLSRMLCAT